MIRCLTRYGFRVTTDTSEMQRVSLGIANLNPGTPGGPVNHQVNLANAVEVQVDAGIPTTEAPDTEDQIVNLGNAASFIITAAVPTVEVPIYHQVFLANAPELQIDASVPSTTAIVDQIVNLDNAAEIQTDASVPPVFAGGNQEINLANAAVIATHATIGPVDAEIVININLANAAEFQIDASIPPTEGESDLPPQITEPTPDQTYTFGQSGTLPAPPHFIGTGDNPTWSLAVDDFSTQPGVIEWSINPTTGDITYNIKALTTDANEQALNTKGPYTTTRRLTTTISNADETFKIFVNVGNYTLQLTPGTACATWSTATPAAQGVEAGMDPSARVSQTYTVT